MASPVVARSAATAVGVAARRGGAITSRRVGARAPGMTAGRSVRGGGHGHHDDGLVSAPFTRIPLPSRPLNEQHELVWHDGVAPEALIDFDASHISTGKGVLMWLGGFAFFGTVLGLVALSDPASSKPAGPRQLPASTYENALGGYMEKKTPENSKIIVR